MGEISVMGVNLVCNREAEHMKNYKKKDKVLFNEDSLRLIEMDRKECVEVQKMWLDKDDKIEY